MQQGCRSDELREATRLLGDPPSEHHLSALREGYTSYLRDYFSSECSQCRSEDEFGGLIEDLTLLNETLDVETDTLIAEVEEACQSFLEAEEQYAEALQDEYREQWRETRHENESIASMFQGLRSDRNI